MVNNNTVGIRKRVNTSKFTIDMFIDKFLGLSSIDTVSTHEHIAGEIFLADKAFAKLLSAGADHRLKGKFESSHGTIDTNTGIIGTMSLHPIKTYVLNVRTNAFQRSSLRDYESLGADDMELRLYV